MIDRYLDAGTMYVPEENGVKAECVVTDEGGGVLEIKNIAVFRAFSVEAYLFERGAERIIPVGDKELAYKLKKENIKGK